MRRLLLAIVCLLSLTTSALAQNWGQGFQPDPAIQSDPNAPYILLGPYTFSGKGAPLNQYRLFNPVSPLSLTDNGAMGLLDLNLGTVPISKGGTNGTTQQAAVNNILNFTGITTGDITYYNGTNWVRLPIGSPNQILTVNGGGTLPVWSTAAAAAPAAATILTLNNESATMPNSRRIAITSDLSSADAGAGSTLTLGVSSNVVVLTGSQSITGQKTLTNPRIAWNTGGGFGLSGTSFTSQLKYADWPAARNLTIPDPGADANFVMSEGAATINGVKTFGSAPKLSTNTLTSSTGNTITFPNAADTVVLLTASQTVTNKTLTSPIISNAGTAMTFAQSTANYAVTVANPTGARIYNIYDANGNADFAMKSGTPTAGGAAYSDGNLIKFTSAGSSGSPLVSQAASPPIFQTLGIAGGGTGQVTQQAALDALAPATPATGDLVYYDGTHWVRLPRGSNGNVLQSTGTTINWAGATGTVTSFSSGNLSPLFTTSVATATTIPALSFSLSNAAAYTVLGNNTGSTGAPSYSSLVTQQLPQSVAIGTGGASPGVRPLLNVPAAPVVTNVGTTGATTYTYKIVARDTASVTSATPTTGITSTAGSTGTSTTTGNATLTGSNYNHITWTAIPGARSYAVWRTAGPSTGCIAITTGTSADDQANAVGFGAGSPSTSTQMCGNYSHIGNFTSDADISCQDCLINIDGNFTLGANTITVQPSTLGGSMANLFSGAPAGVGSGLGGGGVGGGGNSINNTTGGGGGGAACLSLVNMTAPGNSYGGVGGNSSSLTAPGGVGYSPFLQLAGSGGGGGQSAGVNASTAGGRGGGAFAINCTGTITLSASSTITANGEAALGTAAATTGGGGGGGGGGVDLRASTAIVFNASSVINVLGGAGGSVNGGASAGGGGGGGMGGCVLMHAPSITNSGTVNNAGGTGGATSGTSGGTGNNFTRVVEQSVWAPRLHL
jgi:hypothetical protein